MRPIVLAAACAAIVGIAYGMHSPIVPVFAKQELGANFSEVGVIGLANYLPYMVVPIFGGMLLDRINKSYLLILGICLNVFAIFMLSEVATVGDTILLRAVSGIAHAFFWPSAEVIVSTTAPSDKRVKWIAIYTAAWVCGFMIGPLIGKLILDHFTYRTLFEITALAISFALVPSFLLHQHGRPLKLQSYKPLSLADIKGEVTSRPVVSAVVLYYAVTFGVLLAIYPAYIKAASISDQDIELLFFVFGIARFATLPFVHRIAGRGRTALAAAVAVMATGMAVSFAFTSLWSFTAALVLAGIATSIFYPITFYFVTRNAPLEKMGTKLGIYEALFGAGWTVGPVGVGLSSDTFGPASPYLAFSILGIILTGAIVTTSVKKSNMFS
jgi:MFS family permease